MNVCLEKVTDSLTIGNYETSMQGTWIYNPQAKNIQDIQKQGGGEGISDPPSQLQLSVFGYLEDVFRVEAETLAQNGLNSDFSVKKDPPRLEQTDDNRRDIKEPV